VERVAPSGRDLFAAGLSTGGFAVNAVQAAANAAAEIPMWVSPSHDPEGCVSC
jgi:hypothetical protein